jgi:hypothetical protein
VFRGPRKSEPSPTVLFTAAAKLEFEQTTVKCQCLIDIADFKSDMFEINRARLFSAHIGNLPLSAPSHHVA